MTTFKGAMRSYGAAVRRVEREHQRNTREAAKRFKEQQKYQEIANATQAVNDWNNYVAMLKAVHKNCTSPISWNDIENQAQPSEPVKKHSHEIAAQKKIQTFRPSIFDKIFGLTKGKILKLQNQLKAAKEQDSKNNDALQEKFKNELADWKELQTIAKGVKNRDPEFFKQALQYFNPFDDIGELGSQMEFNFTGNSVDIDFYVNSEDVVPDYEVNLTSTGKISKKSMAKGKFLELYQDYICSCILRIARETFAYLELDYVRINAISKLLNSKTGHLEDKPILSVLIPPQTIEKLNLDSIDPSDSMKNFLHNMDFKKTTGFNAVEKIEFKK